MPKIHLTLLACLNLCAITCASSSKHLKREFQIQYVSTTSGLNIRSAPSKEAQILTLAPFNAEVRTLPADPPDAIWVEVEYKGFQGFAAKAFLVNKSAFDAAYLSVYSEFFDETTCSCKFHYYDRSYSAIDLRRANHPKYLTEIIDEARIFIYDLQITESASGILNLSASKGKEYKFHGKNYQNATLSSYKYKGVTEYKINRKLRRRKCVGKSKTLDMLVSADGDIEKGLFVLYNQCENLTGQQIIIPD